MINPYSKTNWDTNERIMSVTHAHMVEQSHVDTAYAFGVRHFAISNYDAITWPMSNFFEVPGEDIVESPNMERSFWDYSRFPVKISVPLHCVTLGYNLIIPGAADDLTTHTSPPAKMWEYRYPLWFDIAQKEAVDEGVGNFSIGHPERYYTNAWEFYEYKMFCIGFFLHNPASSGIEAQTGQNGYYALELWDHLLSVGMPIWGRSEPDSGSESSNPTFLGMNYLLVDEKTASKCVQAYSDGSYYFAREKTDLEFVDISYDNGQISVEVNKDADIRFVGSEKELSSYEGEDGTTDITDYTNHYGKVLLSESAKTKTASYTVGDEIYVRVEAFESDGDGLIFSQPFIFKQMYEKYRYLIDDKTKKRLLLG